MLKAKTQAKKIKDKGKEEKEVAKKVAKQMEPKNRDIAATTERTNRTIAEI